MPGCVCDVGSSLATRYEMSENISIKMGTQFGTSLHMGENVC